MTPVEPVRLNYDQVADTYDQRYSQGGSMPGIEAALSSWLCGFQVGRVLEVGCGTGHWLERIVQKSQQCFGLDRSVGMLLKARHRSSRLVLTHGLAEALPFRNESFSAVFCLNALHHFTQPAEFIREAWRLIQPGGGLAIIGSNPHNRKDQWYIYQYFEGTYEADLARFPEWGEVLDWAAEAGFQLIGWRTVEVVNDPKQGQAVFQDPYLAKNATSQLATLSQVDYQVGLERMQAAMLSAESEGVILTFPVRICFGMLTAWKLSG
jgi:ubiquinone/menaquinone biosynthesis C-methylase UbiE